MLLVHFVEILTSDTFKNKFSVVALVVGHFPV